MLNECNKEKWRTKLLGGEGQRFDGVRLLKEVSLIVLFFFAFRLPITRERYPYAKGDLKRRKRTR